MSTTEQKIFAVVVLYRSSPAESVAFTCLREHLEQNAPLLDRFECLVYDNSPEAHDIEAVSFRCSYIHDPSNPGLARPYNVALARAEQAGASWLMLLDQDTGVTAEYLNEVVQTVAGAELSNKIVAIVPKLVQGDRVLSPHWSLHLPEWFDRDQSGIITREIWAFNLRRGASGIGGERHWWLR